MAIIESITRVCHSTRALLPVPIKSWQYDPVYQLGMNRVSSQWVTVTVMTITITITTIESSGFQPLLPAVKDNDDDNNDSDDSDNVKDDDHAPTAEELTILFGSMG